MSGPASGRIGVAFPPQFSPERLHSVALAADDAGLDDLWLSEDWCGHGVLASAAAVLAWTDRLAVSVTVRPAPMPDVRASAREAGTLSRLFPGRFELGIGPGAPDWMSTVGVEVQSPLTLLREYATALRGLLHGETVTTSGRDGRPERVALKWRPAAPGRLWAGGAEPTALRLGGEVADGVLLPAGSTPQQVAEARRLVDGAAAGADRGRPELAAYLIAATGPGAEERFGGELERRSLNGSPATELGIWGDAPALAAGARRWLDAGADRVVFAPTVDEPHLESLIELFAGEVRAELFG